MRLSIFRFLLALVALLFGIDAVCQETAPLASRPDTVIVYQSSARDSIEDVAPYVARLERYNRFWSALTPQGAMVQFAGNMGMFSAGPLWRYGGNKQWETSLLVGFIPRHSANSARPTLTLKQLFAPWNIGVRENITVEPLEVGFYLNTVLSGHFWASQPDRYPEGYYWFSTRLRPSIFIGQRATWHIRDDKRFFAHSVSAFYQISSCDFLIIQRVHNSSLKPHHFLSLSFGLQFHWL